uniref:Fungal-type protein kinase domain-containing protein n=1 Tax=Moniliophthora roreri TaxID=221103 RepID=A0A0W0FEH0_MONRR
MEASPENLIKAYGCRHRRLTLATPDAGLILSDGKREHAELDMGNRNPLLMYLPIHSGGKAASTMHRIMNDDPRRRFVFGPAFDNDIVRLYFASRTMASVSTPFEMYKDWRILVRIFVALGTARDRTDLGYDDTISVAQDERSYRIFDVSVDNAMFRIINCLSDGSSDATRVWVVRAVREGNAVEHENVQRLKDLLQRDVRSIHLPSVRAAGFVPRPKAKTQTAMVVTSSLLLEENPLTLHPGRRSRKSESWHWYINSFRARLEGYMAMVESGTVSDLRKWSPRIVQLSMHYLQTLRDAM